MPLLQALGLALTPAQLANLGNDTPTVDGRTRSKSVSGPP